MIIDWLDDHMGLVIATLIVVGIALVAVVGWLDVKVTKEAKAECTTNGGEWLIVGTQTHTTYVKSGEILVPLESKDKAYGCVYRR